MDELVSSRLETQRHTALKKFQADVNWRERKRNFAIFTALDHELPSIVTWGADILPGRGEFFCNSLQGGRLSGLGSS